MIYSREDLQAIREKYETLKKGTKDPSMHLYEKLQFTTIDQDLKVLEVLLPLLMGLTSMMGMKCLVIGGRPGMENPAIFKIDDETYEVLDGFFARYSKLKEGEGC